MGQNFLEALKSLNNSAFKQLLETRRDNSATFERGLLESAEISDPKFSYQLLVVLFWCAKPLAYAASRTKGSISTWGREISHSISSKFHRSGVVAADFNFAKARPELLKNEELSAAVQRVFPSPEQARAVVALLGWEPARSGILRAGLSLERLQINYKVEELDKETIATTLLSIMRKERKQPSEQPVRTPEPPPTPQRKEDTPRPPQRKEETPRAVPQHRSASTAALDTLFNRIQNYYVYAYGIDKMTLDVFLHATQVMQSLGVDQLLERLKALEALSNSVGGISERAPVYERILDLQDMQKAAENTRAIVDSVGIEAVEKLNGRARGLAKDIDGLKQVAQAVDMK